MENTNEKPFVESEAVKNLGTINLTNTFIYVSVVELWDGKGEFCRDHRLNKYAKLIKGIKE